MTRDDFVNQLEREFETYETFRSNVTRLVKEYTADNHTSYYDTIISGSDLDGKLDDMALMRSWIEDKLNDNCTVWGFKGYSRTRYKKIRKALGYNL